MTGRNENNSWNESGHYRRSFLEIFSQTLRTYALASVVVLSDCFLYERHCYYAFGGRQCLHVPACQTDAIFIHSRIAAAAVATILCTICIIIFSTIRPNSLSDAILGTRKRRSITTGETWWIFNDATVERNRPSFYERVALSNEIQMTLPEKLRRRYNE